MGGIMRSQLWRAAVFLAFVGSAVAADPASQVDRLIKEENAGRKITEATIVDDLGFSPHYIDTIGRIPTDKEIQTFLALPAKDRRRIILDDLTKREPFADRWTVFFGDMFRIRSNADGGAAFLAHVHRTRRRILPYDVLCRQLLAASGKANLTPEVGYILGDDADPMALASVTSQVFLGVRIGLTSATITPSTPGRGSSSTTSRPTSAKPTSQVTRIKMRLLGVYLTEAEQTSILSQPEDKAKGKPRRPSRRSSPLSSTATARRAHCPPDRAARTAR